jgi:hypothetical protein
MLGIVVAFYALHSHRINHHPLPQADSPPSCPLVLLLSRLVRWSKVIKNSAAARGFQRVSSGTTRVFNIWVGYPRGGVNRSVNDVNTSNATLKRVRNGLYARKRVKMENDESQTTGS